MNRKTAQIRPKAILCSVLFLMTLISSAGCRFAGSPPEITLVGATELQEPSKVIQEAGQVAIPPEETAPGPGDTAVPLRAELIVCEIKGHVALPGVYDLALDSRVADLIVRSGGVLPTGSLDFVNQARKLSDGEVVVIPGRDVTREEYDAMAVPGPPPGGASWPAASSAGAGHSAEGLININTATETELDTIPGVGPATARNIIAYRTEQGPFTVIEDLKKVDRIGEKTFEKLKSYITVNP